MSLDIRQELKSILSAITYTGKDGVERSINVYLETDANDKGQLRFTTPALVIRAFVNRNAPATVNWAYWEEYADLDVSLYLSARSDVYEPEAVRKEVTAKVEELIKAYKTGTGPALSLQLIETKDRDDLERRGTLRRDFTIRAWRAGP